MRRARFKNDSKLAEKLGMDSTQIGRWREKDTTPSGDNLSRLCLALHVAPAYLFGHDVDFREESAAMLEAHVGDVEAKIVRAIGALSAAQRERFTEKVDIWLDAIADQPKLPFDEQPTAFGDEVVSPSGGVPSPSVVAPSRPKSRP